MVLASVLCAFASLQCNTSKPLILSKIFRSAAFTPLPRPICFGFSKLESLQMAVWRSGINAALLDCGLAALRLCVKIR
jgi:hypothetical protein